MKFIKYFFIFLIFCSSVIHAEVIQEMNEETGVYDSSFKPEDDEGRFQFLGGINLNPRHATEVMFGEVQYAINFGHFWGSAFLNYTKGEFQGISENPNNQSSNTQAESNNVRPDHSKVLLSNYGLGVLYRHDFPESLNIFEVLHLYQTTAFYLTYNSLDDYHRSVNYKGPGIKAEYALLKRFSKYSEMGLNFSYNLAEVKRSQYDNTESSHDRTLRISYLTLAFGLAFYY